MITSEQTSKSLTKGARAFYRKFVSVDEESLRNGIRNLVRKNIRETYVSFRRRSDRARRRRTQRAISLQRNLDDINVNRRRDQNVFPYSPKIILTVRYFLDSGMTTNATRNEQPIANAYSANRSTSFCNSSGLTQPHIP